jgi:DNA-directed RNA polymerase subunit RPC12/RpoP
VGIDSRLRRLEEQGRRCPECGLPPDGPREIAVINEEHPEESFDGDPEERCPRCGRSLYTVIRVVYSDEGEGA